MARTTLAQLRAEIAALRAEIESRPTSGTAAQPVHIGPSGKPDGRIFPCTASPACARMLRSEARAAIHGVEAGGHEPR